MMTHIFWNVRGLNDPNKVSHGAETIRSVKPNVIAFYETKKMEFSPGFLSIIVGNANYAWNYLPARNTAGGILLGIN